MPTVTRIAEACPPPSPDALYEASCDTESPLPWFALSIRQKERERCEAYLLVHSYEYFSPSRTETRQWSDRKKVFVNPLFPGYLFCRFHPRKSGSVLRAPGVIEIVSGGGHYLEVDATQIEDVRRCLANGFGLDVVPTIRCGQKVRITSGPLNGIVGILSVLKQQLRVGLEISMMNRTVLVEVESSQLMPC
jgi:transcription termination/antitermination protein NusG